MARWLRLHIWQLGLCVLLLTGLVAGVTLLRSTALEANTGMPSDQRAYWNWVASIEQGADAALAPGIELLARHPQLRTLYLRLADVCRETQALETCRAALADAQPPDPTTRLYREAGLALLDADEAAVRWPQLARDPALDPTLARLIVDRTWAQGGPAIEAAWREQLAADSSAVGAAFGLGYAAVLRYDWTVGESLLRRVTTLAPDDPQAYRELGRIYFNTSKPDKLDQTLEAGIEAAQKQYDLDQEITLRGNLGWTLYLRNGDLKKAETFITQALDRSRSLSKGRSEAINLYRLANILLRQNRYDEAFSVLDSAEVAYTRHLPRRHADVLMLRGTLLINVVRYSDAEQVLEDALAETERRDLRETRVNVLVSLSSLRYKMGRYTAAREAGLQALTLAQQDSLKDREIDARTVLGDVEQRWGNIEAAAAHFEHGFALAKRTKNRVHVRALAIRLGRVALILQDANAAQRHFEDVLGSLRQDEQPVNVANAYRGLGRTYQQFQNTTEALHYYDLALAQLAGARHAPVRADILIAKAGTLIADASLDEAVALFEEAQREQPGSRSVSYEVEVGLGAVQLRRGRYEEALRHFQRAEAIERKLPRPSLYWYVLFGKAQAHARLGERRQAEAAFREAVGVVEALRENLHSSTNRAYFVQDKVVVYEAFAAFLEAQGRTEDALHYTERARSRSLVDLLYTTQRAQKIDTTRSVDRMIEMERRTRVLAEEMDPDRLAEEDEASAYDGAYSATRAAQLRREYERADSVYRQVRLDLNAEQPIYTFTPLSVAAARALLADGEAMVVYDLRTGAAQETNPSVVYLVLPDTVLVRALGVREETLAETIRFFRDQIGTPDGGPGPDWQPAARRLYRDLVHPVVEALPKTVRHLHLVPEGALYYLPFAALQDEAGRFLAERYTLSVTPSASILKLSRDRNPRRWRSMLLFGDPDGRLPGSRKEVLAIASAGSSKRRHALVGEDATQAMVVRSSSEYDILHFATHGRFVPRAPWRSHLELHGGEALSVEEIGQLDLDAYLVTLSACETALSGGLVSDVPNGDEWVGLNQAFLAAGTPTVMASLWPIDDLVSSRFMIDFYGALGSAGKASALASVQRQFIENPLTKHPFYWAAFTIIGDPL